MKESKNKTKKFLNNEMNELEQDSYLQDLFGKYQHKKLEERYSSELSKKYKLNRNQKSKKPFLLVILCLIILSLLAYFLIIKNPFESRKSSEHLAMSYVENNDLEFSDVFRGTSLESNPQLQKAYNYYISNEYENSLEQWKQFDLDDLSLRDKLFYGISALKSEDYFLAESIFVNGLSKSNPDSKWREEVELYCVLSLLINKKENQALKLIESWSTDSWNRKELHQIISNLE